MKRKGFFDNKITSAIAAVLSGIFVDLFYDEVTGVSYDIIKIGSESLDATNETINSQKMYSIVEVSNCSLTVKIFITLSAFVILWIFLCVLIPFGAKVVSYIKGKNMEDFNKEKLLDIYKSLKYRVLELDKIVNENRDPSKDILYFGELIDITCQMEKFFCSDKMKKVVSISFRTNTGLVNSAQYFVSRYEYDALLERMGDILKIIKNRDGIQDADIFKNDCQEIENKIQKLKNVD